MGIGAANDAAKDATDRDGALRGAGGDDDVSSNETGRDRGPRVADESTRPDVYTYNAMILAALLARRPRRALAYRRTMAAQGIAADGVTIGLLADTYVALGRPLNALAAARRELDAAVLPTLGVGCCDRLLAACAAASAQPTDAPAARAALLWTLRRMLDAAAADGAGHASGEGGTGRPKVRSVPPAMPRDEAAGPRASSTGGVHLAAGPWAGDAAAVFGSGETAAPAILLATPTAPWSRRARSVCNVLRTLGNAGDFAGARLVFELVPLPRPPTVWSEMVNVCNQCGEPRFASTLLAQVGQNDGGE